MCFVLSISQPCEGKTYKYYFRVLYLGLVVVRFRWQYLILVLCGLVLLPFTQALSFSSPPIIIPTNNVTTATPFFCQFTPSGGATSANITWYRDGSLWTDDDQNVTVFADSQFQSNAVDTSNTARSQVWICQITINNATHSIVVNSSNITVVNALPIIVDISNQTVYEDAAFSLQMNATDPDNDSVTWFSIDQNASDYGGVSLFSIASSGLISINLTNEDLVGNHSMRLIADDDTQFSGIRVNFELVAMNDAPIITPASLTQQCYQSQSCLFTLAASDEEGDSFNFSANESFINMSLSGTVNFTPNSSQVGNHLILINVSDGINWSTNILNLTINSTNQPPIFLSSTINTSIGVQNQSTNFTFFLNATDPDADDTIAFSIDSSCSLSNPWTITGLTNGSNSSVAQAMINTNLSNNNDFVVCREVTITLDDGSNQTSQVFSLNITNSNDPPIIYNTSAFVENLLYSQFQNTNMSDVTYAKGLQFRFRVNGSDIDNLTYEGENLTYSLSGHDASLFQINATSGLITSTITSMNDSYVGNTSFFVILTDDEGLSINESINITIINNTVPILSPVNESNCVEESLCEKIISAYDAEGDNLTLSLFTKFNSSLNTSSNFSNETSFTLFNASFISFNGSDTNFSLFFYPQDPQTGNYTVHVNISDSFGEVDSTFITFSIFQVNDVPYLGDNDSSLLNDSLTFGLLAEGLVFEKTLFAIDPDIVYNTDAVSYNYSYNGSSLSTNISSINETTALLTITPGLGDAGNYSLNITIIDSLNNFSSKMVNFTVFDSTEAPNITQIRPHINSSGDTIFSFTSITSANTSINVTINESVTTIFDIVATDFDDADMVANWYENGSLVVGNLALSGDASYTRTFNFNESGLFNITVHVIDRGIDAFTWLVSVGDVNQNPIFINNVSDLSASNDAAISGKQVFADFFRLNSPSNIVLLDPDDDVNGNNYLDGFETNNLTFYFNTSTSCNSFASFSFSNEQLTITPSSIGNCSAQFYATDSFGMSVSTNIIRIDILDLGQPSSSSSSSSSSSGSSTRTVTETITVPLENDVAIATKFLFPGISSLYDNGTVTIPVMFTNNWESDVSAIDLTYNASIPELVGELSTEYIVFVGEGDSVSFNLTLDNYRFDAPIEVNFTADIGSLDTVDTATLFINALEKGSYSEDAIRSRVGFARDLLNDNSECAELNEILNDAEDNLGSDESLALINAVIDGCKYLINTQKAPTSEVPKSFIGKVGIYTAGYVNIQLLITIILAMTFLAVGIGIYSRFRLKKI